VINRAIPDRSFYPRVNLVNSRGDHLRRISGAAARLLVSAGDATPRPGAGRIREVEIAKPAVAYAARIGEPSAPAYGVRFHRWVRLEVSGTRIVEHHPRAVLC
jgi:hypothetical protein